MKTDKRNWKLQLALVMSLTLLATFTAPAVEAADHRMRAVVEESFEVNGTLFSPNVVTVRELGQYSPNSVFAEICVGSECVGQLIAYDDGKMKPSDVNSLVFGRSAQGHLVLIGLSFRGEPTRMLPPYASSTAIALAEASATAEPGAALIASRNR